MSPDDRRLIAEWLRHNKVTRCPTAAAAPTTGTIPEADSALLRARNEAEAQCELSPGGRKGWSYFWGVRCLKEAVNQAQPGLVVPLRSLPRPGSPQRPPRPEVFEFTE
jgi:hypothetical protein